MYAFPLVMTVVLRNSVVRNWPAWLAVFGFLSYDQWLLQTDPAIGRNFEYLRITLGWALMLVVVFCVLGDRYLAARREGRLDSGIDPIFPAQERAQPAGPEPDPAQRREKPRDQPSVARV
jgi:arabinofuranan 3-O-arabinosyltransferase